MGGSSFLLEEEDFIDILGLTEKEKTVLDDIRAGKITGRELREKTWLIDAVNSLIEKGVTVGLRIETDIVILHYEINRLYVESGKVCAEIKMSDWTEAENDAYLLRRNGKKVYIDYETDKPNIIVELDDSMILY